MKDVLGSLPEVITAYKNYNLLVPTATDVQLNPFYKFHVEEVPVDLGENSGDIFKVGSVKTGEKDERGKDIAGYHPVQLQTGSLLLMFCFAIYIRHDFGHVKSRRQKRPSHHAYRFCYSGSRPSYIMLSSP